MARPLRVTVFSLGGILLLGAVGTGVLALLTLLSSHYVRASKDFTLADPTTLTIYSDGGGVHLTPSDKTVVHVDRKTTEAINGADPKWSMENGKLTLDTNCSGFMALTCEGTYDVEVPRTVRTVVIRNDDGSISVDHMSATSFDLRSDNGSIKVRDSVAADVKAESDNGSINVDRSWVTRVSTKSDNGSLKVALNNEPDSVRAEADNGSIRVRVPQTDPQHPRSYKLTLDSDNGSKDDGDVLNFSDSPFPITLTSDNGSVRTEYGAYGISQPPALP